MGVYAVFDDGVAREETNRGGAGARVMAEFAVTMPRERRAVELKVSGRNGIFIRLAQKGGALSRSDLGADVVGLGAARGRPN